MKTLLMLKTRCLRPFQERMNSHTSQVLITITFQEELKLIATCGGMKLLQHWSYDFIATSTSTRC